jgi:hypothetical protein
MLIFGMGLYGLFICNVPPDAPASDDRALKGSSLFGMFALKVDNKLAKTFSYSLANILAPGCIISAGESIELHNSLIFFFALLIF